LGPACRLNHLLLLYALASLNQLVQSRRIHLALCYLLLLRGLLLALFSEAFIVVIFPGDHSLQFIEFILKEDRLARLSLGRTATTFRLKEWHKDIFDEFFVVDLIHDQLLDQVLALLIVAAAVEVVDGVLQLEDRTLNLRHLLLLGIVVCDEEIRQEIERFEPPPLRLDVVHNLVKNYLGIVVLFLRGAGHFVEDRVKVVGHAFSALFVKIILLVLLGKQ